VNSTSIVPSSGSTAINLKPSVAVAGGSGARPSTASQKTFAGHNRQLRASDGRPEQRIFAYVGGALLPLPTGGERHECAGLHGVLPERQIAKFGVVGLFYRGAPF
jgi:hypothetical protein